MILVAFGSNAREWIAPAVNMSWEPAPPALKPEDEPEPPREIPPTERPVTEIDDMEPPPLETAWEPTETEAPEDDGRRTIAISDPLGRTPPTRPRRRGGPGGLPGGTGESASVAAPASEAPPPEAPPKASVREPARALSAPSPAYPESARESGVEGVVRLVIEVLEDGTVGEVEVLESSGSQALDAAAIRGVREWTFSPARVDGVPCRSRVRTPTIRFRITDR